MIIPEIIYATDAGEWFDQPKGIKCVRSDVFDRRVTDLLKSNNLLLFQVRETKQRLADAEKEISLLRQELKKEPPPDDEG